MGVGFIKVGSYHNGRYHGPVRKISQVIAHLKYIGFRSRERYEDDKGFFNQSTDMADWRKFVEGVKNHKALQHHSTVKIHKMIFSLREKDYAEYKASGRDYKEIVRTVLGQYEKRHGVKLDWIAVKHDVSNHPHCHVVIRAVTDPVNGKSKRIFFSKKDIQEMKRDFDLEVDKHRVREQEQQREASWERNQGLLDAAAWVKALGNSIEKEIRRAEYERELEKEKYDKKRDR